MSFRGLAAVASRQKRRVDALNINPTFLNRLDAVCDLDQLAASAGALT
jgi:hypothetical protein